MHPMFYLSFAGVILGCFGLVVSLWLAFTKANRPISWARFNRLLGCAALNLFGILLNGWMCSWYL